MIHFKRTAFRVYDFKKITVSLNCYFDNPLLVLTSKRPFGPWKLVSAKIINRFEELKRFIWGIFCLFTIECNHNLVSGKHTWTRSGKKLLELQFRCGSGAFTPEFHLNIRIPEPGSEKITWTFFSVTFVCDGLIRGYFRMATQPGTRSHFNSGGCTLLLVVFSDQHCQDWYHSRPTLGSTLSRQFPE